MRFVSTRGEAPNLAFEDVVLAGLAADGGLYVPEAWPRLSAQDFRALRGLSYGELAIRVMEPYVRDALPEAYFAAIVEAAYLTFSDSRVAPMRQISDNEWLLELFHGPTLAFKDFALQLLGRLFDYFLKRRGERMTVIGATSGDTGSAAIAACRGREAIDIVIFHPEGRVSDVQRRQMTTVIAPNVHNVAVQGTFDDCQALVKALFNDAAFRAEARLGAVNSINWARIMAQIVYYVHAALQLGGPQRAIAFAVPTGNFGDVYAGYAAHRMGLPVSQLVVATNRNDILARFLADGAYHPTAVEPTMSPSMDIQVASNFERLLFELYRRSGEDVGALMTGLARSGQFTVPPGVLEEAQALFDARSVNEDETLACIAAVHDEAGVLIDPHTAVGIAAGRKARRPGPASMVYLATAHPAKFPEAVERATGQQPQLPPPLADLLHRDEHYDVLPNDVEVAKDYVCERL